MFPRRERQSTSSLTNRVFLLSRRWPHHAGHSGYDRLGDYVGEPLTAPPISRILPDRIYQRATQGMRGYDRTGIALELLAAKHMAVHRGCLYHLLYGDNCYNYLGALDGWRDHKVVATFHHPPSKFAEWVQRTERLEKLAAAVVVGRNQLPSFEEILPAEKLFFVPHPVDTTFYRPPSDFSEREENLCLFVGAHLRDIETLCMVIEDAFVAIPQIEFAVVAHPSHVRRFESVVGNLTVYCNLSEAALLDLYRKATILIQPLIDATANNAILEAMSCGLPMIVTDVGAVRDYVDEETALFVPPFNPPAMLSEIIRLTGSRIARKRMASYAREKAIELDWECVALQMNRVYAQVLNRT